MNLRLMRIAELLQFNSKEESKANMYYTQLLIEITEAIKELDDQDVDQREMLKRFFVQIQEFIEDEMHHLRMNQDMFTEITGIMAADEDPAWEEETEEDDSKNENDKK